jgi:signal recognition particle receptor subunit beta
MVLFNYSAKELTAKVVYYGPGLCGKTTNLQVIYNSLPQSVKGKMLSLSTKTDRTLFFDFLPLDLGEIAGMKTRIQLYTVPGQVFYNETRRLVLKGSDGIVFVADSQAHLLNANIESFNNLEDNLKTHGMSLKDMPLVIQFNKRDLPSLSSTEEMNLAINKYNAPFYESVATTGIGVQDTLRAITKLVLIYLSKKFDLKMPVQIEEIKKEKEEEASQVEKVPQAVGVTQQQESRSSPGEDEIGTPVQAATDLSSEPASTEAGVSASQDEPLEQVLISEEQIEEKESVTETSGWLPQDESTKDQIPSMPVDSIPQQSPQSEEEQTPSLSTQDQTEAQSATEEAAPITSSPDQPLDEDQPFQEIEISISDNFEEPETLEEENAREMPAEYEDEPSSLPQLSDELPDEEAKEETAEAIEERVEEEPAEPSQESNVEFELKEEVSPSETKEAMKEKEAIQISSGKDHEIQIPLMLGTGKNKKQFLLKIYFKFEEDKR